MISRNEQQIELLRIVQRCGDELGVRLYLVGGVVRDLLLAEGDALKDLDLIVAGSAARLAHACISLTGGTVKEFPRFLTAKIIEPKAFPDIREIDFASARSETYPAPGQLPVVQPAPIEEDMRRRDFSINAIALPLQMWLNHPTDREAMLREILDLTGGLDDLAARSIRMLHPESFADDPTRIFRAIRYAERLGGTLESATDAALNAAVSAGALRTVSKERVVRELRKICAEDAWSSMCASLSRRHVFESLALMGSASAVSAGERLTAFGSRDPGIPAEVRFQILLALGVETRGAEIRSWLGRSGLPAKVRSELTELSARKPERSFASSLSLLQLAWYCFLAPADGALWQRLAEASACRAR